MEITIKVRSNINNKSMDRLLSEIIKSLEDHKAQDIIPISLAGKCSISEHMIIASGTSQRHLQSLGKYVQEAALKAGVQDIRPEGSADSDWVLIDLNSVIVHLFRPETRAVYDLEGMWADVHELRQQKV